MLPSRRTTSQYKTDNDIQAKAIFNWIPLTLAIEQELLDHLPPSCTKVLRHPFQMHSPGVQYVGQQSQNNIFYY